MNTQQVERELAAILQRRAEAAMNQTNTQTELLELDSHVRSQAQRDRRRWAAGGALAAAAVVVAGFALWPGEDSGTSAADDTDEQTAEQVADDFLEAFAAGDLDQAESLVAPGAVPWEGWRGDLRAEGVLAPQYLLQPCEPGFTTDAGTRVTCPFDYYFLRSDELGLEPFSDNQFSILVQDGKVVSGTVSQDWFNNGQSDLVEALGEYVRQHHPGDWAAMHIPGDGTAAEQRRAARLWEQYTQEYVDAQEG